MEIPATIRGYVRNCIGHCLGLEALNDGSPNRAMTCLFKGTTEEDKVSEITYLI